MDLYEVIDHVVALLQKHRRITYRALKLQFALDNEHLEALKEERELPAKQLDTRV